MRHDPVKRLNDHHAEQLLDVSRAFAGHLDAVSARATSIDDNGVSLVIKTADGGEAAAQVEFGVPTRGARRRLAFQTLALHAAEEIRRRPHKL